MIIGAGESRHQEGHTAEELGEHADREEASHHQGGEEMLLLSHHKGREGEQDGAGEEDEEEHFADDLHILGQGRHHFKPQVIEGLSGHVQIIGHIGAHTVDVLEDGSS